MNYWLYFVHGFCLENIQKAKDKFKCQIRDKFKHNATKLRKGKFSFHYSNY